MKLLNMGLAAIVSGVIMTLAACGGGSSSTPTPPPTPVPTAPGAPTGLVATAGNAVAVVTFTAPANNGGSAITGYAVSSSPAGGVDHDAGTSALNHLVTGLTNGVHYTFTATASNVIGVSGASSASNEATPHPPTPAAWSITGSLQMARYGHTATLLANGGVLVAGGIFMPGNNFNPSPPVYLSGVEQYDPTTKIWTTMPPLAKGRSGHTATLLPNGKVMIAGGFDAAGSTASVELYDPATKTWTAGAPLSFAHRNHTATLLSNGKVLVVGGGDGVGTTGATELYDPASNAWTPGGTLVTARDSHTAVPLPNGKVLVVGGRSGAGLVAPGAELYDPATNAWTAAARPTIAFGPGTLTLLASGKALFVSGYKPNASTGPDAELYDPVTNVWTLAGTLSTSHEQHTATLLSDGTVLVVGGGATSVHSATTYATGTCELFDPATNTWSLTSDALIVGARLGHTATRLSDGSVLVGGGTSASGWMYQTPSADAALYKFL